MNFKGSAKKAQPQDFADAAASINVSEAAMRTVIAVETAGRGFDSSGRPEILFERHRFYAELRGSERNEAVRQGLAYPRWGTKPYPRTSSLRYQELDRACQINETAALKSTSWGLGQIMGSEHDEAGYASPQEMVRAFMESERLQLQGMVKLIQHRGLDRDMRNFNQLSACAHFARIYNGAGYKKNRYDTKLYDNYRLFSSRAKTKAPMHEDGTLRLGSRGSAVRALQEGLNEKGYLLRADGIYGTRTRDMVLAWQADNGLSTDGEMQPEDLVKFNETPERPISAERAEASSDEIKQDSTIVQGSDLATKITTGAAVTVGGAEGAQRTGLLDKGQEVADKAQQVHGIFDTFRDILHATGVDNLIQFVADNKFIFLGIAGIACYFIIKRIKAARIDMHRSGEAI